MYKKLLKKFVKKSGYDIHKKNNLKYEFYKKDLEIITSIKPFTLSTEERIFSLIEAVRYVLKNNIEGDFVECGVWKGGSIMTMIKILQENNQEKDLYLYDTFAGMTKPTEFDRNIKNNYASDYFEKAKINDDSSNLTNISLEEVKKNIMTLGYNSRKLHYVVGKVEKTLPRYAPEKIALLRLDTDWYESTKHELIHLFPLLSKGGIIIIDDYWSWQGSKLATDEYFQEKNIPIFLRTTDIFGGVIGVKI